MCFALFNTDAFTCFIWDLNMIYMRRNITSHKAFQWPHSLPVRVASFPLSGSAVSKRLEDRQPSGFCLAVLRHPRLSPRTLQRLCESQGFTLSDCFHCQLTLLVKLNAAASGPGWMSYCWIRTNRKPHFWNPGSLTRLWSLQPPSLTIMLHHTTESGQNK